MSQIRIGIDLGGTKIAAMALAQSNEILTEKRIPTPRECYADTLAAIAALVREIESDLPPESTSVGIGIPGSIHPATGLVQNANSTWLNDRPLKSDIESKLKRQVRIANDANCFAISEAVDGAGKNAQTVFGVILGTGCGGGYVVDKKLPDTPLAISGEWGHTPLPWPEKDEYPGPQCWCGRLGCMETWVSGPGVARDHRHHTGDDLTCEEIAERAKNSDHQAKQTLERHLNRLARGLATVVNILDPEIIVIGGGLSQLTHIYADLETQMTPHIFSDAPKVTIRPPLYGDASGARGAAWLWPETNEPNSPPSA